MMRAHVHKVFVVAVAVMVMSSWRAAASYSPEEAFAVANSLYAQEQYEQALQAYAEILDAGWEAPELYFNLSNCYLRTGRPGYALLMCKRAQRLAPGDEDIEANLDFIKSLVREGSPAPESSRLLDLLLSAHRRLSMDDALLVASASAFVLAALVSLRIICGRGRRIVGYLMAAAATVLVASTAGFGAKLMEERGRAEAVIVAPLAEVRSGPGEDFVVQTTLGEGAEVRVRRPGEKWTEVALGPDLAGWVKTEELGTI